MTESHGFNNTHNFSYLYRQLSKCLPGSKSITLTESLQSWMRYSRHFKTSAKSLNKWNRSSSQIQLISQEEDARRPPGQIYPAQLLWAGAAAQSWCESRICAPPWDKPCCPETNTHSPLSCKPGAWACPRWRQCRKKARRIETYWWKTKQAHGGHASIVGRDLQQGRATWSQDSTGWVVLTAEPYTPLARQMHPQSCGQGVCPKNVSLLLFTEPPACSLSLGRSCRSHPAWSRPDARSIILPYRCRSSGSQRLKAM